MSSKIPVTCIITTYDTGNWVRANMLLEQLKNFHENLIYPNIRFLISDDGSENHNEIGEKVLALADEYEWALSYLNTERRGVGYAKNHALEEAFKISPLTFIMEDDWILKQPFDLLPHVQVMLDNPSIGIIRMGFLGGNLEATYTSYGFGLDYWKLKRGSGVYVYSGQVSLRGKNWYDAVGYHKENCTPGEEELDMCLRANACETAPDILWPANYGCTLNAGIFENIGMGMSLNNVQPRGN